MVVLQVLAAMAETVALTVFMAQAVITVDVPAETVATVEMAGLPLPEILEKKGKTEEADSVLITSHPLQAMPEQEAVQIPEAAEDPAGMAEEVAAKALMETVNGDMMAIEDLTEKMDITAETVLQVLPEQMRFPSE